MLWDVAMGYCGMLWDTVGCCGMLSASICALCSASSTRQELGMSVDEHRWEKFRVPVG